MAEERVPEIAVSTVGQWILRIPSAPSEDYGPGRSTKITGGSIELPLRAILEHVRSNIPNLWREVDEAAGKAS